MLPIQLPPAPSAAAARQPLAALMANAGAAPTAPSTPSRPRTQTPAGTPLPSPGPGGRFHQPQALAQPLALPQSQPLSQTQHQLGLSRADRAPPIVFDAGAIARKDESARWDDMLEGVLFAWVARVVEERRVFEA